MSGPLTSQPGPRTEEGDAGSTLMLDLPAKSPHARWWFWFAMVWNAAGLLTGAAAVAAARRGAWHVVPLLSLFPLVGTGCTLVWVWTRFGRTVVHAEPGRVTARRRCLGVRWSRSVELAPGDRAAAVRVDDPTQASFPLHAVRVRGAGGRAVMFGGNLTEPETRRVAAAINEVLRGSPGKPV